ncbi:MAG: glycerol dehydrogenase [Burkholderiaceae bacterium]
MPSTPRPDAPALFAGPLRYLQGPGVLDRVGDEAARFARRALLIADADVLAIVGDRVLAACAAAGVDCQAQVFGGEVTVDEIERLAQAGRAHAPELVLAAGGGKGIDAGKGAAHRLGLPVLTIPTAASNDAPTSHIFVIYDNQHRISEVGRLNHNPVSVVVDSEIIARAPRTLLLAGIGDAFSKAFEVRQCRNHGGSNVHGGLGTRAALALADLAYDILREHSLAALDAVERKTPNASLEAVIEAAVLHSGLSFENGGLSIAHAMCRGLTGIRGARDAPHGLQVTYGLLVQFVLEGRKQAFLDDIRAFYRAIGLPRSLVRLGVRDPSVTAQELARVAELTLAHSYAPNFEYPVDTDALIGAIQTVESWPD